MSLLDGMGGGYAIIPRSVRKCTRLSDGAKMAYMAIVDYAFNNLFCFPSRETLAEDMGCNVWTVSNRVKELREFGLVKVYQQEGGVNRYILMPLARLKNLTADEVVKVSRDNQYVDQAEFEALIESNREFYASLNVTPEQARKPARRSGGGTSFGSKMARYVDMCTLGQYDQMKANDLVVGFALKYQEVYGEAYAVNWKSDSTAVKLMLIDKGIAGQDAVNVLEYFVTNYGRLFHSTEHPKPRAVHLKVDWIYRRLLREIVVEAAGQEPIAEPDNIEIVGDF